MNKLYILLAFGIGGVVGALTTYVITKKKYEDTLAFELDGMKDYYLQKEQKAIEEEYIEGYTDGIRTISPVATLSTEEVKKIIEEGVVAPITDRLNKSKESVNLYKTSKETIDYNNPPDIITRDKHGHIVRRPANQSAEAPAEYFEPKSDEESEGPDDGYEDEDSNPNSPPHLIDEETFSETELEFSKVSIQLYSDEVLIDEDQSIMNIADTIGKIPDTFNYDFGNVAFVRNARLGIDYEIERLDRSYHEEIYGHK